MGSALKKLGKSLAKGYKKKAKALKHAPHEQKSSAVKFAESVRGIIYLILGVSLIIALILI